MKEPKIFKGTVRKSRLTKTHLSEPNRDTLRENAKSPTAQIMSLLLTGQGAKSNT